METQKPSIGRIVHYQSYGTPKGEYKPEPRAAIITEVTPYDPDVSENDNSVVSLCIMNPTGLFFTRQVYYSSESKPGCWSWPTKV